MGYKRRYEIEKSCGEDFTLVFCETGQDKSDSKTHQHDAKMLAEILKQNLPFGTLLELKSQMEDFRPVAEIVEAFLEG